MKKIEAIIRHFKLEDVKNALSSQGIQGMTILEVRGFGRQKGHTEIFRGSEYPGTFVPKLKIEIAVENKLEKKVVATIGSSAKTGKIGDGKIFVHNVDRARRIRTGETDNEAL